MEEHKSGAEKQTNSYNFWKLSTGLKDLNFMELSAMIHTADLNG